MATRRLVDLHLHSAYSSDGQYPPAELVRMAEEKGLAAVALTDHDDVGGLPEFMAAGAASPVETIPGVELTCDLGRRWVHILGYFIDWEAEAIAGAIMRNNTIIIPPDDTTIQPGDHVIIVSPPAITPAVEKLFM